jgi:hypothetical protein
MAGVERGVPTLIEKPLATDLAQSARVLAAITDAKLDAVVGYTQRFRRKWRGQGEGAHRAARRRDASDFARFHEPRPLPYEKLPHVVPQWTAKILVFPAFLITKRLVESLKSTAEDNFVWDDTLIGFGGARAAHGPPNPTSSNTGPARAAGRLLDA